MFPTPPPPNVDLKDTAYLAELKKEIENIEFYSPTIPASYQEYHATIKRLIQELNKPPVGYGDGI